MESKTMKAFLMTVILIIAALGLVTPVSAKLWQWEQVSEEGFGDLTNDYAWSMATYTPPGEATEYLYVGTLNQDLSGVAGEKGCEVYRTNGTMTGGKYVWKQVVGPTGSQATAGFTSVVTNYSFATGTRNMVVYKGLLWTGTGPLAEVFVTNGTTWKMANKPFFGTGGNATIIKGMTVYNGSLYVEAEDRVNGDHVYRYDGPANFAIISPVATWKQVNYDGFDNTNYTRGSLLIPFDPDDGEDIEYLYAVGRTSNTEEGDFFEKISNPNGLEIWRTNGTINPDGTFMWERIVGRGNPYGNPPGWGDDANSAALTVYEFQNDLYVGTLGISGLKAQLWRTTDGTTWECVEPAGFGRPNIYMWRLTEYQGKLIVGTMDAFFGCELWASETGDLGSFEQINLNGMDLSYTLPANFGAFFGTDFIVPAADQYGARSVAEYQGYLVVGTASWGTWVDVMLYAATNGSWQNLSNYVGCEIWRSDGTELFTPPISVTKTVWNGTAWAHDLTTHVGNVVRFNITIENNEATNITNMTIVDFLSDSLEYGDDATLTLPDGAVQKREPDCDICLSLFNLSMLKWQLSELTFEPGQTLYLEYDAYVVKSGVDGNFVVSFGRLEEGPEEREFGFGGDYVLIRSQPAPAPAQKPLGLLALVGLLSAIAAVAIVRKRR